MRIQHFLPLMICGVLVSLSAQGACGGGGSRSSKVQTSSPRRESVTVSFDTSRFDSVSARLGLSDGQYRDVSKAKSEINERYARLKREKDSAQANLENCQEGCESERRKLEEANARLSAYDPKSEFKQRLASILSQSQMRTYESN